MADRISITFLKYSHLVARRALKDFGWRDPLTGVLTALLTLLLQGRWGLIAPGDWHEHKLYWELSIILPFAAFLLMDVIYRLISGPWRLHEDQDARQSELQDRLDQANSLIEKLTWPADHPQIVFDKWGQIPSDDPIAIPLQEGRQAEAGFLQKGFYLVNDGGSAHDIRVDDFEIEPSVRAGSKPVSRIESKGRGFVLVWLAGHPSPSPEKWNLLGAMAKASDAKYRGSIYSPDYAVKVSVVYRDANNPPLWFRGRAELTYIRSQGRMEFGPTIHEKCGLVRPH